MPCQSASAERSSNAFKGNSTAERNEPAEKIESHTAGSDADQEYVGKLRALISDPGLEEIIELQGLVEDTASLIASAD
ncbi:MAG: hypothetical protein GYA16_08990 [Spirochaetes bacterium]|nr:hypothetical protein [Spirochaetota bacterium]